MIAKCWCPGAKHKGRVSKGTAFFLLPAPVSWVSPNRSAKPEGSACGQAAFPFSGLLGHCLPGAVAVTGGFACVECLPGAGAACHGSPWSTKFRNSTSSPNHLLLKSTLNISTVSLNLIIQWPLPTLKITSTPLSFFRRLELRSLSCLLGCLRENEGSANSSEKGANPTNPPNPTQ